MCSCIPLLSYSNASIKSRGRIDLKPSFTNTHLLYKRTKHLFHIPKFIPDKNLVITSSRKNRVSSLYESFKTLQSFQVLPVVHAKLLTKEQIEELQKQKKQINVTEKEIRDYISNETGQDRLRQMFKKDHKGCRSFEFGFVWDTSFRTGVLCYLMFYIIKFRDIRQDFVRENKGTTYYSVFMAGRRIRDRASTIAMKHGAKWAIKVFSLIFTALLVSQSIAVYRNKSSAWEYIIGTGVAGSFSRFYMGPKGMFSGLVLGSILGIPIGLLTILSLKNSKQTQEERHYFDIMDRIRYEKECRGEIGRPVEINSSTA